MVYLKLYRQYDDVCFPEYATDKSACFDIRAYLRDSSIVKVFSPDSSDPKDECTVGDRLYLESRYRALVPTGLIFDIPQGYSIRIHPRSGLALKEGLTLINCEGVIDEDYVEPAFITIYNTTNRTQIIRNGERLCQAELVKVHRAEFEEIDEPPEQKTDLDGGFGSTGK